MGERGLAWPLFVGALAVAGCGGESWCGDWVEWGADASHNGTTCKRSEIPKRFIADTVFDPFVAQEIAEAKGQLPIRYQTPLVVGGDDLYMGVKSGTYVSCDPPGSGMPAGCGPPGTWASEVWGEAYWDFHEDGTITPEWTFVSDWKPEPVQGSEPLFHAAANSYDYILYVPGAGGTLHKLHRHTGVEMGRLNPFGDSIDAAAYVAGPVSIAAQGNVYYNVLRYQGDPLSADAGGWLVKIDPQDRFTMVSFADLVAGAPAAHAACTIGYPTARYSPPYPPLAA